MCHTSACHSIQDSGRTWDGEKDFKMGTKVFGQYDRATGTLVGDTREGVLRAGIWTADWTLDFQRVSQGGLDTL